VLHYIIFITACAQNVFPQHKSKHWTLTRLNNSTFNNVQPKVAHSLLMHHFFSATHNFKINMITVKYVTDF